MFGDLLKSPVYHQNTSKFSSSTDVVADKKRNFSDVIRIIGPPNNNGLNKVIWATTSSGDVYLKVRLILQFYL